MQRRAAEREKVLPDARRVASEDIRPHAGDRLLDQIPRAGPLRLGERQSAPVDLAATPEGSALGELRAQNLTAWPARQRLDEGDPARRLEFADACLAMVEQCALAALRPFAQHDERTDVLAEVGIRYADRKTRVAQAQSQALDEKQLRRAERLGIVVPLGEGRYEIPSPTLVRAGETLIGLGIPLEKSLDVIEDVARQADSVAAAFVKLFLDRIWKPFDRAGQPESDWPNVRAALEGLRPLASDAVVSVFQQRMSKAVEEAFGKELQRSRGRR